MRRHATGQGAAPAGKLRKLRTREALGNRPPYRCGHTGAGSPLECSETDQEARPRGHKSPQWSAARRSALYTGATRFAKRVIYTSAFAALRSLFGGKGKAGKSCGRPRAPQMAKRWLRLFET